MKRTTVSVIDVSDVSDVSVISGYGRFGRFGRFGGFGSETDVTSGYPKMGRSCSHYSRREFTGNGRDPNMVGLVWGQIGFRGGGSFGGRVKFRRNSY